MGIKDERSVRAKVEKKTSMKYEDGGINLFHVYLTPCNRTSQFTSRRRNGKFHCHIYCIISNEDHLLGPLNVLDAK